MTMHMMATHTDGTRTELADVMALDFEPRCLIGNAAGKGPGLPPDFARYPSTVCTLFNSAGHGLNVAAWQAVPDTMSAVVCVKDVDQDPATVKAILTPWLDVLDRPAAFVPHHEPKPDETASVYVGRANVAYDIIDAHPNGHYVDKGCKFGGWNQANDWQPWLTGREDWIGWDIYSQSVTAYPDPAAFIAPAVAASQAVGKPFALTEFNVLRLATDLSGAYRARFCSNVVAHVQAAGGVMVQVWDGKGTPNKTYPDGIPFGFNQLEYEVWRAITLCQG